MHAAPANDVASRSAAPSARAVTPGKVVLRTFKLAEIRRGLDIAESTAWRWAQPVPKGTGGVVPSRYHLALLRLAHQLDRPLTADDLVFGRADD
jgi:hypothetical protein